MPRKTLEQMTVSELKQRAGDRGIQLGGARRKDEIVKKLRRGGGSKKVGGEDPSYIAMMQDAVRDEQVFPNRKELIQILDKTLDEYKGFLRTISPQELSIEKEYLRHVLSVFNKDSHPSPKPGFSEKIKNIDVDGLTVDGLIELFPDMRELMIAKAINSSRAHYKYSTYDVELVEFVLVVSSTIHADNLKAAVERTMRFVNLMKQHAVKLSEWSMHNNTPK